MVSWYLESGVRVACDVGYLCANFSFPIGRYVLELGPMYATDRQTSERQKHRLMPPPISGWGITIYAACNAAATI